MGGADCAVAPRCRYSLASSANFDSFSLALTTLVQVRGVLPWGGGGGWSGYVLTMVWWSCGVVHRGWFCAAGCWGSMARNYVCCGGRSVIFDAVPLFHRASHVCPAAIHESVHRCVALLSCLRVRTRHQPWLLFGPTRVHSRMALVGIVCDKFQDLEEAKKNARLLREKRASVHDAIHVKRVCNFLEKAVRRRRAFKARQQTRSPR